MDTRIENVIKQWNTAYSAHPNTQEKVGSERRASLWSLACNLHSVLTEVAEEVVGRMSYVSVASHEATPGNTDQIHALTITVPFDEKREVVITLTLDYVNWKVVITADIPDVSRSYKMSVCLAFQSQDLAPILDWATMPRSFDRLDTAPFRDTVTHFLVQAIVNATPEIKTPLTET